MLLSTRLSLLGSLLAAAALLAPGCAGPSPESPSTAEAPATAAVPAPKRARARKIDYVYDHTSGWKSAAKRLLFPPLKGDQNTDIRAAHPEFYAVTAPPANGAQIRPMVEWEPMKAIVMAWPADYTGFAKGATATAVQIAIHAATVAEVWFFTSVNGTDSIKTALLDGGMDQTTLDTKVKFIEAPLDSIWFIDEGPVPIIDTTDDTFAFADFRYYYDRPYDDATPTRLARALPSLGLANAVPTYRMPLNVEGGTFQATTDGICITGNRQLYYMSCDQGGCDESIRTAPLGDIQSNQYAEQMRGIWGPYLGCKDIIVTNSITDDGTGHIDMYLKIVDDNTILVGQYVAPFQDGTPQAQNAQRLDDTAAFLEAYVKPDGSHFTVKRLVMPGHRSSDEGMVPFTYINSTFINGLNLWPATEYHDWEDSRALAQTQWEEAMPSYQHIWIDATELSFWSGAIHCITRTVPDLTPGTWVPDGTCTEGTCGGAEGGYAGACKPTDQVTEDIWWGPAWECECNDCTMPCESACPAGLSYTGCCDGDALVYCDKNQVQQTSCAGAGCGWSQAAGFYDCAGGQSGAQANVEDPSGHDPRDCGALMCVPECTDRVCGDDGCGGSCGTCSAGEACNEAAGACEKTCEDTCEAGASGCEGEVAWACVKGVTGCYARVETDCTLSGKVCKAAACFDKPAQEDTGATTADAAGGDSADSTQAADVGPAPAPPSKKSSGCGAAQRSSGPLSALAGLLLLALWWGRRRA